MIERIVIENCQDKHEFNEEVENLIKQTIRTCLNYENFIIPYEVSVTITDNDEIKDINNEHRGINKPTDVLSFPMTNISSGKYDIEELKYDMDEGVLLLGDIVISFEKAIEQANEYGHSVHREIAFLTAHGMMHLLGYDHMNKNDELIMFTKQEEVLKIMGLKRN